MSTIGRYKAIVVSGQESLSRQWVDQLSEYARNGGTLVLGGNTADYNEYRQKRAANPLLSLAGISRAAVITLRI